MFYKLLAGELPFKSDAARDVARAAIAVFEGRAIPIQRWLPDIDPALAEVIHKALSRDPEGRFSRAAEMAEPLAPWADERSSVVLQRIRKLERESNRPKVPRGGLTPRAPRNPTRPPAVSVERTPRRYTRLRPPVTRCQRPLLRA